ncbi:MAG: GTP cyclohydrolase I FolE [Candidatus Dormibacteria bacterium]
MMSSEDRAKALDAVRELLSMIGESPEREGLRRTPERVLESFLEMTSGYRDDPAGILTGAVFAAADAETVVIRNIQFHSLCEHHLLPFYGLAQVAYLPAGRIIGLSKVPRLVDCFARRLQVQERLTGQIAEAIQAGLEPQGVAVVLEAEHLCMAMRGVGKPGSRVITTSTTGVFRRDQGRRDELRLLLGRQG